MSRTGSDRRRPLFTFTAPPCHLLNHVANRQHCLPTRTGSDNGVPFIFNTMERLSHCTRLRADIVSLLWEFSVETRPPPPPVTQAYASTTAVKQPSAAGRGKTWAEWTN